MTVAELTTYLQHCSPGSRVVVKGYEGGYDDVVKVSFVRIEPDPAREGNRATWMGNYMDAEKDGEVAVFVTHGR